MKLTENQVKAMLGKNKNYAEWTVLLNDMLPDYDIDSVARIAGFMSQCAHESRSFTVMEENLWYSESALKRVFLRRFRKAGKNPKDYAKQPEKIGNFVYQNMIGNGNEASGDGYRFRGRGIIQLTGRDNYTDFGKAIGKRNLDDVIEYVQTKRGALEAALWFWSTRKINKYADRGDIRGMTKKINGGTNGLSDRTRHYKHFLEILGEEQTFSYSGSKKKEDTGYPSLSSGDRGEWVKKVQKALGLRADGVYGPNTKRAVKSFQRKNRLTADGIAGPATLAKLLG